MPVVNLFSTAASFLYAVSTMLGGAQNNAAVQQSFVTNYQSSPTHFLPILIGGRQRTPKAHKFQSSGSLGRLIPSATNISGTGSYYEYSHESGNSNYNGSENVVSTIFFPSSAGGGYGQSPPNRARVPQGPIEINYHDGETIATLFTDEHGNVTRCEMLEVNKPSEQQEALANLAAQKKLIEKTNFNTMLNIMRACQALDKTEDGRSEPTNTIDAIVQTKTSMWTVVNGILPGTKWCGVRDIAEGWNDLGVERELDKCCRTHDLCPRKVLAFRAAYGLVNWSFYTKSHCECDAIFYDCLRMAAKVNPTSEVLGSFYFNVLRMQCLDEEKPPKCISKPVEGGQSCKQWETDSTRANQRFVFREYKQEWE